MIQSVYFLWKYNLNHFFKYKNVISVWRDESIFNRRLATKCQNKQTQKYLFKMSSLHAFRFLSSSGTYCRVLKSIVRFSESLSSVLLDFFLTFKLTFKGRKWGFSWVGLIEITLSQNSKEFNQNCCSKQKESKSNYTKISPFYFKKTSYKSKDKGWKQHKYF